MAAELRLAARLIAQYADRIERVSPALAMKRPVGKAVQLAMDAVRSLQQYLESADEKASHLVFAETAWNFYVEFEADPGYADEELRQDLAALCRVHFGDPSLATKRLRLPDLDNQRKARIRRYGALYVGRKELTKSTRSNGLKEFAFERAGAVLKCSGRTLFNYAHGTMRDRIRGMLAVTRVLRSEA